MAIGKRYVDRHVGNVRRGYDFVECRDIRVQCQAPRIIGEVDVRLMLEGRRDCALDVGLGQLAPAALFVHPVLRRGSPNDPLTQKRSRAYGTQANDLGRRTVIEG